PLPLPQVELTQFRSSVSGAIGSARRDVTVQMALVRGGDLVGLAQGRTRADGRWGPLPLRSDSGAPHAAADDRDVVIVRYGSGGPPPDLISTGDGGNPFTESGWTGWFDLDHGYQVGAQQVKLAPCGQTGRLTVLVAGRATAPPIEQGDTESDVATVATRTLTPGTPLEMSSQDNRAVTIQAPLGALVKLSVPVGEPGSVSALGNGEILFRPSGFPSCDADLRTQVVRCSGLRPGARYTLTSRSALAKASGVASFSGFARGLRGQVLSLRNRAGRVLTRLHVAHLRVDIKGAETVLGGGSCQPGDYYGLPLRRPPVSAGIGAGVGGEGVVCPTSGRAAGLSALQISQIDDLSSGLTETQVPLVQRTTPLNGETLYGGFVAQARSGLPGPTGGTYAIGTPIDLTISHAGSGARVFHARNVNTVH